MRSDKYGEMTDQQINRLIAERKGYKLINISVDLDKTIYQLVNEFGEHLGPSTSNERTALSFTGYDWAGSVNAALTLIKTDGSQVIDLHWNPGRRPDHNNFVVLYDYTRNKNYAGHGFEGSVPLSRCICEAWLVWGDEQP